MIYTDTAGDVMGGLNDDLVVGGLEEGLEDEVVVVVKDLRQRDANGGWAVWCMP